jgi:hypothetical protein
MELFLVLNSVGDYSMSLLRIQKRFNFKSADFFFVAKNLQRNDSGMVNTQM